MSALLGLIPHPTAYSRHAFGLNRSMQMLVRRDIRGGDGATGLPQRRRIYGVIEFEQVVRAYLEPIHTPIGIVLEYLQCHTYTRGRTGKPEFNVGIEDGEAVPFGMVHLRRVQESAVPSWSLEENLGLKRGCRRRGGAGRQGAQRNPRGASGASLLDLQAMVLVASVPPYAERGPRCAG